MLNKIMIVAAVAIVLGAAGAATARSHHHGRGYSGNYGLGYSLTARSNPTNTNGF